MRPDASAKLAAIKPKDGPSKVLLGAVIAAVLIVALVVVVIVNAEKSKTSAGGPAGSVDNGGGIALYQDKAKAGAPTLDVYEDFQCPFCGQLEATAGKDIIALGQSGAVKLTYHTMTILDRPGKDDSLRASNAALCAADAGKFTDYHAALFAAQPQEGVGYTDATLKSIAGTAGMTGDVKSTFDTCVTNQTYQSYAKNMQTNAEEAGVFSTPKLKLDGKALDDKQMSAVLTDPKNLDALVKAATK